MPAKRKRITPKAAQTSLRSKKLRMDPVLKKHFRLLDLPTEVLDQVLSYVIEVPSHPQNGALNADVMVELFPAATTQVNRLLRQRTIDVVSRSVLWLELKCTDHTAIKIVRDLNIALPVVPAAYQDLVPASLQKVSIHFGDPKHALRTTRTLKEENATFLFPFNYHSFAVCSSRLGSSSLKVKHVTIHVPQLSAAFQKIVDLQVMPLVRLVRYDLDVEILHENGERKHLPKKSLKVRLLEGITKRILKIVDMVHDLDQLGLKLEATLLCMYHGLLLKILADYDPEIERLESWAHPTGKLGLSDWQTDTANLYRMKVFRSLHYIEYRACLGYIEAVNAYGWVFVSCHYSVLSNPPLINCGTGTDAFCHFVKALIFQHIHRYYKRFENEGLLDSEWTFTREETAIEACVWAYYAWTLDRTNTNYQKLLLELEADCDPIVLRAAENSIANWNQLISPHHRDDAYFNIHPSVLKEWMRASEQAIEYLGRAQEIAKLADVQYDKRRGERIPSGFTQQSREAQKALFKAHGELQESTFQPSRFKSIDRRVLCGISKDNDDDKDDDDDDDDDSAASHHHGESANYAANYPMFEDSDEHREDDSEEYSENYSDDDDSFDLDDPFEQDYFQDFQNIAP